MIEENNCFIKYVTTTAKEGETVYGEYKSQLESSSDESKIPYELLLERKNLVDIKISDQECKRGESVMRTPNPTFLQKAQLNIYQMIDNINEILRPKQSMDLLGGSNGNGNSDLIKCINWHPQHRLLAVCNKNDVIFIYYFPNQDMYGMNNVKPLTLWFELQSKVCDIQWKPFFPYTLAVACENGIILWEIDLSDLKLELKRTSVNYKLGQSTTCCNILNYPYFISTSITWSSNGLQLACGSNYQSSILLWDIPTRVPTHIPRYNGNSLLLWSPKNDYLLSCSKNTSRIYEISKWDFNEKEWQTSSNLQSGSWSEKGDYLAIASGDKIQFIECINRAFETGGKLVHIEKTSTYKVQDLHLGGHIKKIVWSHDNQRLAVIFYQNLNSKVNDQYCAIYKIKTSPIFSVTPRGFIRSINQPINSVSFVPNYKKGSLLSLAYNDGTIKFFPLLYKYKQ